MWRLLILPATRPLRPAFLPGALPHNLLPQHPKQILYCHPNSINMHLPRNRHQPVLLTHCLSHPPPPPNFHLWAPLGHLFLSLGPVTLTLRHLPLLHQPPTQPQFQPQALLLSMLTLSAATIALALLLPRVRRGFLTLTPPPPLLLLQIAMLPQGRTRP
eukprot:Rmarinus@m.24350